MPLPKVQASASPPLPADGRSSAANDLVWVALAAAAASATAALVLAKLGAGPSGTEAALRATARFAFVLFLPAYAGGALVSLVGPGLDALRRRSRTFGLCFAAALAVHLALVAWLSWTGHAPSRATFAIFGVGVVCAAALTLGSIRRLGQMLGPHGWWALRAVAMNYLLFDFAFDFLRAPPLTSLSRQAAYVPFQILVFVAAALRLAAWVKRLPRRPADPALQRPELTTSARKPPS